MRLHIKVAIQLSLMRITSCEDHVNAGNTETHSILFNAVHDLKHTNKKCTKFAAMYQAYAQKVFVSKLKYSAALV